MTKKHYKDFIGDFIEVEISPYQYKNGYDALKSELWKRIKKELSYQNGLLCEFKNIETKIDSRITVSGIVQKCEVDC